MMAYKYIICCSIIVILSGCSIGRHNTWNFTAKNSRSTFCCDNIDPYTLTPLNSACKARTFIKLYYDSAKNLEYIITRDGASRNYFKVSGTRLGDGLEAIMLYAESRYRYDRSNTIIVTKNHITSFIVFKHEGRVVSVNIHTLRKADERNSLSQWIYLRNDVSGFREEDIIRKISAGSNQFLSDSELQSKFVFDIKPESRVANDSTARYLFY